MQNVNASLRRVRVAVIGAGVSGLAAAKCLLDEGIEPVVFERAAEVGGVWNFHEEEPDGGGPAYRSLHTNTSRQTTAFSDFPFPASLPDFPARAQVLGYLNDYATRFDLLKFIRLRSEVEAVAPSEHPNQHSTGAQGDWKVVHRTEGASEAKSELFDGVMVCSGLYRSPVVPSYPGSEAFQGEILHSRSYKGPEGFEGKEIVVVGTGSSGADIAVELSMVASKVTFSAIRGAWLLPRYIGGKPYDHHLTRLATHVPYELRMRLFQRLLFGEYRRMGISDPRAALGAALPAEPLDVLTRRLTPGSEIIRRIASGSIAPKPGIASLDEKQVVFTDGTRSRADTIILATGYNMGFPFLQGTLANPPANVLDIYKLVFHPELPGLAFIGMCTVAGPGDPRYRDAGSMGGPGDGGARRPPISTPDARGDPSKAGAHPEHRQQPDACAASRVYGRPGGRARRKAQPGAPSRPGVAIANWDPHGCSISPGRANTVGRCSASGQGCE